MKLSYPISNQKNIVTFNFKNLVNESTYIVWWYGAVVRDDDYIAQPYVQVLFREIIQRNDSELTLSSNLIKELIPLPLLSSVLIGSLWHDGASTEIMQFPRYLLNISFAESGWQVRAVNEIQDDQTITEFPLKTYPLKYGKNDQTQFITFNMDGGNKLIFNCMEFFRGTYGHSIELKRVLMRYPYWIEGPVDSILSLLIHEVDEHDNQEAWVVKQPKRSLTKGDAIFLAHLKYDPYTQLTIKRLANQRTIGWHKTKETGFSSYFFPAIKPWHQSQDIQIRLQGIPYGENNILGLRIEKISNPHGSPVHWIKCLPNSVIQKVDPSTINPSNVITRKKKVNRIPVATHVRADVNTSGADLPLESMTIGNNRMVKVIATTVAIRLKASGNSKVKGVEPKAFSAADNSGTRGKTGHITSVEDETDSALSRFENAWNEAKALLHDNQISKVQWYDRENETFVDSESIAVVGLHAENGQALRVTQAFIMQITTLDQQTLLCIELTGKTGQEGFSGLMVSIDQNGTALTSWIEWLFIQLIWHRGIFKRFMVKSVFKHYKIYHHGRSNKTIERVLREINQQLP